MLVGVALVGVVYDYERKIKKNRFKTNKKNEKVSL